MINFIAALAAGALIVVSGFTNSTAENGDDILGIWWTPDKNGKIEIIKRDDFYYGKIIWGKDPRKDINNPDPMLQNRSLMNMEILRNFRYDDGDKQWVDGSIYDPNTGNTYSCLMWLENGNLKVKGYIGFSFLGRTEVFEKVRENSANR